MNTIKEILQQELNEKTMKLHGSLYHSTNLDAATRVITNDKFKMTSSSNSPRDDGHPEKFYMSLSRSFMKSRDFGDITFIFKGDKLMQIPNKKIYHYNFNNSIPMKHKNNKDSKYHNQPNRRGQTSGMDIEDEERITNNTGVITNFNKYIEKVFISEQIKKRTPVGHEDFIKLLNEKNIKFEYINGFKKTEARTTHYKSRKNKEVK